MKSASSAPRLIEPHLMKGEKRRRRRKERNAVDGLQPQQNRRERGEDDDAEPQEAPVAAPERLPHSDYEERRREAAQNAPNENEVNRARPLLLQRLNPLRQAVESQQERRAAENAAGGQESAAAAARLRRQRPVILASRVHVSRARLKE